MKSRIAIEKMKQWLPEPNISTKILIVVPRLVLIDNWKEEFKKWKCDEYLNYVTFITYVAFPKTIDVYNTVIFDEAHHLSDRCIEALDKYKIEHSILLSATVNRDCMWKLQQAFPKLFTFKISVKQAIKDEVLPDPKVYLIPMSLDNTKLNYEIIKNKSQKMTIEAPYTERFKYLKIKNRRIVLKCTQYQYYNDISNQIEYYKRKTFNEIFKNRYLRLSGARLKWLSKEKTLFIHTLLDQLKGYRTLTFCSSIEQTEQLGKHCIHSNNKLAQELLVAFNKKNINHITCVDMLNEGMNLNDCQIGIYASLHSSQRLISQQLGRLLRHPNPILIIPYFAHTRDEEIINKMLEDYNPELVTTITHLKELTL